MLIARLSERSANVPNNHSCCRSHGHYASSLAENKQFCAGTPIAFVPSELATRVPIPLGMLVRELPPRLSCQNLGARRDKSPGDLSGRVWQARGSICQSAVVKPMRDWICNLREN